MAVNWVGEWDTEVEGAIVAGQTHTFVAPRFSTFEVPAHLQTVARVGLDIDGTKSPDTVFANADEYWTSHRNSHVYIGLIETVTDEEGVRSKTVFHSGSSDGFFPGVQSAQIMLFTGELTSIRPTPDRPSQWDTYHDPYIFNIPLTGSSWQFTCNRNLDNGQIVVIAET